MSPFPSRQPNVVVTQWVDSLILHTPRGTVPQGWAKAKPFGCVTGLAPDRSQSLVCCPTVNPTVPYAL